MSTALQSQPPAAGEAAHTPTRYYREHISSPPSGFYHVFERTSGEPVYLATVPSGRVADLIVDALNACKSHAALVEALEHIANGGDNPEETARAALESAKEGQR